MRPINVDPEKIVAKMARQIGQLSAELAVAQTALESAHERISELESESREKKDAGD